MSIQNRITITMITSVSESSYSATPYFRLATFILLGITISH